MCEVVNIDTIQCQDELARLKLIIEGQDAFIRNIERERETLTRQVLRQAEVHRVLSDRLRSAGLPFTVGDNDKPSIGEQKHD